MKRKLTISAALVLVLTPAWAFAQGAPSPSGKFDPNEMICRKMVITGSRLDAHKICQTRGQWEARSRNQRNQFDQDMQRAFSANCTAAMSGGTGTCSG